MMVVSLVCHSCRDVTNFFPHVGSFPLLILTDALKLDRDADDFFEFDGPEFSPEGWEELCCIEREAFAQDAVGEYTT